MCGTGPRHEEGLQWHLWGPPGWPQVQRGITTWPAPSSLALRLESLNDGLHQAHPRSRSLATPTHCRLTVGHSCRPTDSEPREPGMGAGEREWVPPARRAHEWGCRALGLSGTAGRGTGNRPLPVAQFLGASGDPSLILAASLAMVRPQEALDQPGQGRSLAAQGHSRHRG